MLIYLHPCISSVFLLSSVAVVRIHHGQCHRPGPSDVEYDVVHVDYESTLEVANTVYRVLLCYYSNYSWMYNGLLCTAVLLKLDVQWAVVYRVLLCYYSWMYNGLLCTHCCVLWYIE